MIVECIQHFANLPSVVSVCSWCWYYCYTDIFIYIYEAFITCGFIKIWESEDIISGCHWKYTLLYVIFKVLHNHMPNQRKHLSSNHFFFRTTYIVVDLLLTTISQRQAKGIVCFSIYSRGIPFLSEFILAKIIEEVW